MKEKRKKSNFRNAGGKERERERDRGKERDSADKRINYFINFIRQLTFTRHLPGKLDSFRGGG